MIETVNPVQSVQALQNVPIIAGQTTPESNQEKEVSYDGGLKEDLRKRIEDRRERKRQKPSRGFPNRRKRREDPLGDTYTKNQPYFGDPKHKKEPLYGKTSTHTVSTRSQGKDEFRKCVSEMQ